jgi:uncharacterized protein (TIGR02147 family)
MRNLYESTDLLDLLQGEAVSKKQRGHLALMAKAAGCQAAYLSQVLRGKANLTTEHIHRLCGFWKLNETETDYVLFLHHAARAGNADLQAFYLRKAQRIREEHGTLAKAVGAASAPAFSEEDRTLYYSSWLYAAIHMLVSIPHFQTAASISQRLGLPLQRVDDVLSDLCRMGLVTANGKSFRVVQNNLHIDQRHPLHKTNHINWRSHCSQNIQNNAEGTASRPQMGTLDLHYTAVHTLSRNDVSKIRDILLDAIRLTRDVVGPSPEEDAVVVLIDCYRLQK